MPERSQLRKGTPLPGKGNTRHTETHQAVWCSGNSVGLYMGGTHFKPWSGCTDGDT
jgi:hypothetical protein